METCGSCGLQHRKVECSGIWHCPNALCMGCGGAWFRNTLDSLEEDNPGRYSSTHSVCMDEWLEKGKAYNKEHKIDRQDFFRVRSIEKKKPFIFARKKLRDWISKFYKFLED